MEDYKEIDEKKAALRREVSLKKALFLSGNYQKERAVQSGYIKKKLEESLAFSNARMILLYASLPDEVDTDEWISQWSQTKTIVMPCVGSSEEPLLRTFTGWNKMEIEPRFGIRQPLGPACTDFTSIDLAILPGVAFDGNNRRLGRGKGYYDRLLPYLSKAFRIGVCFHFQLVPHIPVGPLDMPVDAVYRGISSGKTTTSL